MQKKLLAVAVAGALAVPGVALAQSSVTISGAVNIWTEVAGATGATNTDTAALGFEVKSRQRVGDGNGSNIRFTAVEDIGGGMQGFAQVESAVVLNSDTRTNAVGTAGGGAGTWGNRNTAVGLRGSSWGEFLIGVWDIHYNEQYAADNQLLKGPSHSSVLGLMNTFGVASAGAGGPLPTIGGRTNNVLRYQSPNWSGFNFKVAYARPTDGVVPNLGTGGGVTSGKKNTLLQIAPQYSNGPIFVGFSWMKDKDFVVAQAPLFTGGTTTAVTLTGTLGEVTSQRLSFAYTFPFGLKLGAVIDSSKYTTAATTGSGSELKRTVWSLPVSWTSGPHAIFANYAVASKLKGSIGGADLGTVSVTPNGATTASTLDSGTGAKFMTLGYQFDLSKRTNVHANFTQIKNDQFATYDMFANGVGMTSANYGADPRIISLGLRHAF